MARLLVVEDQPNDLKIAAETARLAGFEEIDARTSAHAAIAYLEKGLLRETPLPDGIVLDLDLGYESGYELLRHWHSTPGLRHIPMIIWTILGEEQREICSLFKVQHYISKWEGLAVFRETLSRICDRKPHQ